mgnify:CR=1 FL=1
MPLLLISRRAWLSAALFPAALCAQSRRRLAGIEFELIRRGAASRRYLLIHGNEQTAREVLLDHMRTAAGVALLVTGSERWVTLRGLRLDPNRMFSRAGAERSFTMLNPAAAPARIREALDWLDRRRDELLRSLLPPRGGLLVALHNNSSGYSVETEIGISESVALPTRGTPHEFMLATSPADFEILARSPFNVVLQQRAAGEDDGSLSRRCAARGIRYVNIEARLGNAAGQRAMLKWLEQNLP